MRRYSFLEYLNSKGKIGKPVVDPTADRTDPMESPNKPPKGGKPYGPEGKKPGKAGSKGFGDLGEKELVFDYETRLGHKGAKPAEIPTAEQLDLACLVADAVAHNPTVLEEIVRQIRRRGAIGALVAEVFDQPESYAAIRDILGHRHHGPKVCADLVRALHEEVAPSFSSQMEEEDDDKPDEADDAFTNTDQEDGQGIDDGNDDSDLDLPPENIGGEEEAQPCPTCNQDGSQPQGDPQCQTCMGAGTITPQSGMDQEMPMPDETDPMSTQPQVDPMMGAGGPPAMRNFQNAYMRYMMGKN